MEIVTLSGRKISKTYVDVDYSTNTIAAAFKII